MSINESIFKAYDIHVAYPEEIDEKAMYAIMRASMRFLKVRSITVAMDNCDSSPENSNKTL